MVAASRNIKANVTRPLIQLRQCRMFKDFYIVFHKLLFNLKKKTFSPVG